MKLSNLGQIIKKFVHSQEYVLDLNSFKGQFDIQFQIFLRKKINNLKKYSDNAVINEGLKQFLKISIHGKRIRPYMAYLGYKMSGGRSDIFNALIAIELFHLFALIHDDIIDHGHERHKTSTIHCHLESILKKENNKKHIALSQAILIGDIIFALSMETLISNTNLSCLHNVRTIFNQMIEEVVIGQMIDVDLINKKDATEEQIAQKNLLKTARYSFVNPLKIGSALAGEVNLFLDFFEKFGTAVGQAYQIQDDLLDIIGDQQKTGKEILSDLQAGQPTYFTQHILKQNNQVLKNKLLNFWGRKLTEKEKKQAIGLFRNSGAIYYGQKNISMCLEVAEISILENKLPENFKKIFNDIILILKKRIS
jgi:geranylgeranyl diphosphate synthase type I